MVTYFDNEHNFNFLADSDYDITAPSCKALHDEGATQSGTYSLSMVDGIDDYYCHSSKLTSG